MSHKIVIGSRGSKLALIQAKYVADQINILNPGIETEIRTIVTEGDHNRKISIKETDSTGIFVKALEEALLEDTIDIAVHSMKDLPTTLPDHLCLTAATIRLDARDALVARTTLNKLKPGCRIGTGSLRRTLQLKNVRRDIDVCAIRGNIDTRLRKVSSGELDGIIVSAAAMQRLGWEDKITEYLPLDQFLPAVGQGSLALEAKRADEHTIGMARSINHFPTWQAITAERAFLHTLGGGCCAPISALATVNNGLIRITGMIIDPSGVKTLKDSEVGDMQNPAKIGIKLANKMLDSGADKIIKDARCL